MTTVLVVDDITGSISVPGIDIADGHDLYAGLTHKASLWSPVYIWREASAHTSGPLAAHPDTAHHNPLTGSDIAVLAHCR